MAKPNGSTVRKLFSKAERAFIWKQTVGHPTGVVVEIAGFAFDLCPLTTAQALQILDIIDSIPELKNAGDLKVDINFYQMMSLIAREGKNVMALAKSILRKSADATGLIEDDEGVALFEEWFGELELRPTVTALTPALLRANGLESLLKNAVAPTAQPAPAATEVVST